MQVGPLVHYFETLTFDNLLNQTTKHIKNFYILRSYYSSSQSIN